MTVRPDKPCKAAKKHTKNMLPFSTPELMKSWIDNYTLVDTLFHKLEYDKKQYYADQIPEKELLQRMMEIEGQMLQSMIGMMGLHEWSHHLLYDAWNGPTSLKTLRDTTEALNKEIGKHEPLLNTLHEEFDKTAEARVHGKQIYK